jgi:hypothetical protein
MSNRFQFTCCCRVEGPLDLVTAIAAARAVRANGPKSRHSKERWLTCNR